MAELFDGLISIIIFFVGMAILFGVWSLASAITGPIFGTLATLIIIGALSR